MKKFIFASFMVIFIGILTYSFLPTLEEYKVSVEEANKLRNSIIKVKFEVDSKTIVVVDGKILNIPVCYMNINKIYHVQFIKNNIVIFDEPNFIPQRK